ncbi:hypothetical protein [Umezawaea tangerina]|uniref:Uncharacterized protein n=1 Tax=Umezawaea tangerina TaxID=84725 RepID=A0A2T0TJ95_9PSEU|nr:hypothetical protein [Umezawaea tangerina]PRY45794.1 hypothetical protein CLV43_10154 [Umezawaea tangerina]
MHSWVDLVSAAFVGVMLLIALWPTDKTAAKVLRRWRVADPTAAQVAESKVYLKRRRLLYPWLFVGTSYVSSRVEPEPDFFLAILVTVLAGMLLAELIAALRPSKGRRREAVLAPRRALDLVPVWGVALFGVSVVAVLVVLLTTRPLPWVGLAVLAVGVLAALGGVRLAVTRPTSGDEAVDSAFRVRSARVALGLGVALTGLVTSYSSARGLPVLLLAVLAVVFGLGWLATPPYVSRTPVRR